MIDVGWRRTLWGLVQGIVVVGFVLAVGVAMIDAYMVTVGFDCPLGLQFERDGSEVVERRPFPPRVVCRYEYVRSADGEELFPPEVEVHDSAPTTVVAGVATVAFLGVIAARRRIGRRDDGAAGPVAGHAR